MRIIVLKENNYYVAQWLEKDLAAQGRTLGKALQAFANLICCELDMCAKHDWKPFEKLEKAPKHYHDLYKTGVQLNEKVIAELIFPRKRKGLNSPKQSLPKFQGAAMALSS